MLSDELEHKVQMVVVAVDVWNCAWLSSHDYIERCTFKGVGQLWW